MKKSLLLPLFCLPAFAHAHVGDHGGGFVSGFTHPALGLDHLLAMVAVGLLSARLGGRAIWSIPAVFVGMMLTGGLIGMAVDGFPFVELGIVLSVLLLGIALAANRIPEFVLAGFVAFFAFFHGYAHGAEMPATASPALFTLGFVLGTAVLHLFGVLTGRLLVEFQYGKLGLRVLGVVIAGFGVQMLLA